jgi:cytochrome c-type biogenesis protein CcmH/NrfF
VNVTSRGVKTGLGLVALLLPGGLLFLVGWVLVRALTRASARRRQETTSAGDTARLWQVVSQLSLRDVLREARAAL